MQSTILWHVICVFLNLSHFFFSWCQCAIVFKCVTFIFTIRCRCLGLLLLLLLLDFFFCYPTFISVHPMVFFSRALIQKIKQTHSESNISERNIMMRNILVIIQRMLWHYVASVWDKKLHTKQYKKKTVKRQMLVSWGDFFLLSMLFFLW